MTYHLPKAEWQGDFVAHDGESIVNGIECYKYDGYDYCFTPDSCDCKILVDITWTSKKLLKKCKLHNTGDEAHAHNQSFNLKHGPIEIPADFAGMDEQAARVLAKSLGRTDVTDYFTKMDEIAKDKTKEKERIRKI